MAAASDREIRMECIEAAMLAQFTAGAAPELAASLGLAVVAEQGAVAGLAAALDVLTLNRVVGLGVAVPVTEPQLDRLIAYARAAGVRRLFLQLAPHAAPEALVSWVRARGAQPYNRWVRLSRALAPLPAAPEAPFRIAEIVPQHGAEFAAVVREAFGMPQALDAWLAGSVGLPGWHHFGAWDGEVLAATGALYVQGATAWVGYDATRSDHRGRGAQAALIVHRCHVAASLGCNLITAETAEPQPDKPVPSYRNYLRLGFSDDYHRQNYALTLIEPEVGAAGR